MLHAEVLNIASQQTTATSSVIPVDMFIGFDIDLMLADAVHYNEAGAAFIASRFRGFRRYFRIIKPLRYTIIIT